MHLRIHHSVKSSAIQRRAYNKKAGKIISTGGRAINSSGDLTQAFVVGGTAFSVDGNSLDRDCLVPEAGLEVGISARHTVGVGYNSRNHGVIAQWQMSF
jgi:hypothetical protein